MILNILKNISQKLLLPLIDPTYCKIQIKYKFALLKIFNKKIKNINFINTKKTSHLYKKI